MKKTAFMLLTFFCTMMAANAMKTRQEGDLSCLKGQEAVNTKFTYNNMTVGKMSEQDYLDKKVGEKNKDKAGDGDRWLGAWENDKQVVYPGSFCDLFAKHSKIKADNLSEKPYTIEVNTDFFEPGWNIGIASENAYISVTILVYETANPEKILGRVTILKAPGRTAMGTDFAVSDRVGEAYAKAGKEFAKVVLKSFKGK